MNTALLQKKYDRMQDLIPQITTGHEVEIEFIPPDCGCDQAHDKTDTSPIAIPIRI